MAITASHLTDGYSGTDANSYATASVSPTANSLVLLKVYHALSTGSITTPTASGAGLTFTAVQTLTQGADPVRRITIFRGLSASPSSGAITIDFGGQTQDNCTWSVDEFAGIDTSGSNGSGAIVQSGTESKNNSSPGTGVTVTLSAFADANNAAYGSIRASNTTTDTIVGSGFSSLEDKTGSESGTHTTEWKNSQDTTVDWTWESSTRTAMAIGIEVAIAPAVTNSGMFLVM